jgi:hypothetical protein
MHYENLYLFTMEFYSSIRKKRTLLFAGKWMKLENVMLKEVPQAQEATGHMFSLIHGS